MAEVKNIEADELRRAQAVRQTFAGLTHEYGKLQFAKLTIRKEQKTLENRMDALVNEEELLMDELNDKYGTGTLNVETGEFTPATE